MSFIRSSLEYAAPVWDACPIRDAMALEHIEFSIAHAVLKLSRFDLSDINVLEAIGGPSLTWRRRRFKLLLLWDLLHGGGPPILHAQVRPTVSSHSPYLPLNFLANLPRPRLRCDQRRPSCLLLQLCPQAFDGCTKKRTLSMVSAFCILLDRSARGVSLLQGPESTMERTKESDMDGQAKLFSFGFSRGRSGNQPQAKPFFFRFI